MADGYQKLQATIVASAGAVPDLFWRLLEKQPGRHYRPAYVGHDTVTVAGVSIIMVGIPAGTFQMGDSNTKSVNQGSSSTPVHSVTLASFSISQTLVTQAQYLAVMDTNPSYFNSGALSGELSRRIG